MSAPCRKIHENWFLVGACKDEYSFLMQNEVPYAGNIHVTRHILFFWVFVAGFDRSIPCTFTLFGWLQVDI